MQVGYKSIRVFSATGYGEILQWIKNKTKKGYSLFSNCITKEPLLKILNTSTANLQGVTIC